MITKKRNLFTYLGIFFIFLLWFLLSTITKEEIVMPSISTTFRQLFELLKNNNTYLILLNSIGGLVLIIVGGSLVALILALISVKSLAFKSFISPILSLFKILPVPAIIILFLVQFSQEITPYLLTSMVIIPIIYDGIYGNIISIDDDLKDEVKMISNLNFKVWFQVYLPVIRVGIITTLLQSFGIGLKVKVMTEFVASSKNTIGYALNYARAYLLMDLVFAWTLILVLIVVLIDAILNYLIKKEV